MIKQTISYQKLFLLAMLTAVMISHTGCSWLNRQRYSNFTTLTPIHEKNIMVMGILGGNEGWGDDTRGIRQLARKLSAMDFPGVNVETLENRA
jgi:hypothetical protein